MSQPALPFNIISNGTEGQEQNTHRIDPYISAKRTTSVITTPTTQILSHHGYYRGSQNLQGRPQGRDRPKKKSEIPDCSPWLLVQTKLGRRFVHNPESGESFWKFPSDVLKAVVEYDRMIRENGSMGDKSVGLEANKNLQAGPERSSNSGLDHLPAVKPGITVHEKLPDQALANDDEEYEEVEVTDDEDRDHPNKRQKTAESDDDRPVELNEDDIAYQLAAMGEAYGLDPGEYGNGDDQELEEGAEGLGLTEEDSKALFKDMLNDFQISPYATWENIIEAGDIIEDDRYTVLPNMKSRKEVWGEWSKDTIQRMKKQQEKEKKKDPRVAYFSFLESHATPKLYWPEFRRKYRKEPEIHSTSLLDKDREKWYREYINRLKLPESALKRTS